jgi:hypothetical protein
MPLLPVPPTDTRRFFRPVVSELITLLRGLPAEVFDRPTVAGTWRVRDVVAHLVDISLRRLSFHRDGHPPPPPAQPLRTEREFVAFINGLEGWFDLGREFTEHWHHQAQVRGAVAAPPLRDPAWLHALLLIAA